MIQQFDSRVVLSESLDGHIVSHIHDMKCNAIQHWRIFVPYCYNAIYANNLKTGILDNIQIN